MITLEFNFNNKFIDTNVISSFKKMLKRGRLSFDVQLVHVCVYQIREFYCKLKFKGSKF